MSNSNTSSEHSQAGVDLIHGPILKSLILFALPIMGSSIFQLLYNTVDTMIVGNVLGEMSLAAIGAATPIYNFLICWATGMGGGIAIVTARSYGQNDMSLVKKSVASALVIGAGTSIVITILSRICLTPLLVILNTPENIIGEARTYVSTICLFTIVTMAYNLASGLLRAVGNSVMPLIFLIISSLLNIVLDLLFVGAFGMGIQGAAIATVISQFASVVCCLIYVSRRVPLLVPEKKDFLRLEKDLTVDMLEQGFSMGMMSAIVDVGTIVLQYGINGMGEYIIAGHSTARKVFQMFSMMYVSMGQAISTFTSQNRGANQPLRIRKAIRSVTLLEIGATVIFSTALYFAGRPLLHLLSGSDNEILLTNGTMYVRIAAPFLIVLGAVFNFRLSLQGLGMKILPLISSIIEMVGKILFVIFLIPLYGYTAVIFCEPSIWCVMTISLVIAFYTNGFIRGSGDGS